MSTEEVRPGQIWADNDQRCAGRSVRVDRIEGDFAYCTVLTNRTDHRGPIDSRGKAVRLLVRRMRPTSTGWSLLQSDGESV